MANTDKFTIKVNLDAEQAKKGLNQLKHMVEGLQRLASKPMSININTKSVDNLNARLKATSDRLQSITKGITAASRQAGNIGESKAQQEARGLAPQSMRSALSQFGFGKIATALTSISAALAVGAKFTADTASTMTKTSNLADSIGANTQQIIMLGQIMQEVGGDSKEGASMINKMYQNMLKLVSNPDANLMGVFASAGIRLTDKNNELRDPFDVIKDVSSFLSKAKADPALFKGDQQLRNILGQRLGYSTTQIQQLMTAQEKGLFTKESLTQREKSLGVTDADVKTMREFNENVQKASIALENLSRQFSIGVASKVNEITDAYKNDGVMAGTAKLGSMSQYLNPVDMASRYIGGNVFGGISNWWNNSKEAYQKSQPSAQMNLPNQSAQQPSKNETHIHVNELNVNANNPKEFTDGIMQNTYLDIYNNNSAVQA